MRRGKARPFVVSNVRVDYDAVPRIAILNGLMTIERSPQANSRPIYARMTLAEAEHLEDQLHRSIAAIKEAL